MPKIKTGSKVPAFSLPTTGGGTWSLKEAAGRKLVIYFYPRDLTSGCTREAQDFRDHLPAGWCGEAAAGMAQGESARSRGGSA
jgi:peroxiredoxin Q/BCP